MLKGFESNPIWSRATDDLAKSTASPATTASAGLVRLRESLHSHYMSKKVLFHTKSQFTSPPEADQIVAPGFLSDFATGCLYQCPRRTGRNPLNWVGMIWAVWDKITRASESGNPSTVLYLWALLHREKARTGLHFSCVACTEARDSANWSTSRYSISYELIVGFFSPSRWRFCSCLTLAFFGTLRAEPAHSSFVIPPKYRQSFIHIAMFDIETRDRTRAGKNCQLSRVARDPSNELKKKKMCCYCISSVRRAARRTLRTQYTLEYAEGRRRTAMTVEKKTMSSPSTKKSFLRMQTSRFA